MSFSLFTSKCSQKVEILEIVGSSLQAMKYIKDTPNSRAND